MAVIIGLGSWLCAAVSTSPGSSISTSSTANCHQHCDYRTGIYWIDIFRDIGYSLKYFRKRKLFSVSIYPAVSQPACIRDSGHGQIPSHSIRRCINLAKKSSSSTLASPRTNETSRKTMEEVSMRKDAIQLEETRLQGIKSIQDYPDVHERHRVFPAIFEDRQHKTILDVAAGVGCAAQRIQENYPADLLCNDITPTCLTILQQLGIPTVSFDLDDDERPFPFPDGHFDAIISLATIEHLLHVDHFLRETHRILNNDGYLYLTSPNYAALCLFAAISTGRQDLS